MRPIRNTAALVVIAIILLASGATYLILGSTTIESKICRLPQDYKGPAGIPNVPPTVKFSRWHPMLSLQEAQQSITEFAIRLPAEDVLPKGFSLRGVMVVDDGPSEYKGIQFKRQMALLFFWDREIDPEMSLEQFYEKGGIQILEWHRPWDNPYFLDGNPEREWSSPTCSSPIRLSDITNYKDSVFYQVKNCWGCYGEGYHNTETLFRIAASLAEQRYSQHIDYTAPFALIGMGLGLAVVAIYELRRR